MPCIMGNEKEFISMSPSISSMSLTHSLTRLMTKENQEKPENNTSTLWYSTESKYLLSAITRIIHTNAVMPATTRLPLRPAFFSLNAYHHKIKQAPG